jgi:hypothetical protein
MENLFNPIHSTIMNTLTHIDENKLTLFEIGEHFYALESLIIDNEGEIDDTIDQWLAEYQAKLQDKVDAYCYLISKYQGIADEAERLAQRAKKYSTMVNDLKYRLKYYMESTGKEKIETSRFTLKVTANGGSIPVALNEGVTAEDLPDKFVRLIKDADLTRLRESMLKGDADAYKFASFLKRGTHLRIK